MKQTLALFSAVHVVLFSMVFPAPRTRKSRNCYDCAIVCGYFANEDGSPSEFMKTRVEKAAELLHEGKVRSIIFSGAAVYNKYVEAEVMADYAESLGVPQENMILEKQAVSTYHNMLYSRQVMQEHGYRSCAIVTNVWHLRKASHYAAKFGLDYVMCAAKEPEGVRGRETWWHCVKTNVHMYLNMFRGYW